MSIATVTITPNIDNFLDGVNPTFNYGAFFWGRVGAAASVKKNSLLQYIIPEYSGNVKSVKLRLYVTGVVGTVRFGVYLMDSPQDDIWVEGTKNGATDNYGSNFTEYARGFLWGTAGGDFASDPIGVFALYVGDATDVWYEIDIPIDNWIPISGKTVTLVLSVEDGTVTGESDFEVTGNPNPAELVFDIDVDGFDAPTILAEAISSTEIRLTWDETELHADNFLHYLIEKSDNGAGGWTTLATITDKETLTTNHTGLVVQGDVDDYDEDGDTYPNGRPQFYRISVVSNNFGATAYGTDDTVTIPAMRPVSLTFLPKSKYADELIALDNVLFKPYGVEVTPAWYDANDITEEQYIDKLHVDSYFRTTSGWPGAADESNDFSPISFVNGGVIEGDIGYKPYKHKGKIYDTGGLYRVATTDKVSEQFDLSWPAPCPIAVPTWASTDIPPDLGGPFTSGDLVNLDFSHSGQQFGLDLFDDDWLPHSGDTTNKWNRGASLGSGGTGSIGSAYDSGLGCITHSISSYVPGATNLSIDYRNKNFDEGALSDYLSMATGGYSYEFMFNVVSGNVTLAGAEILRLFASMCSQLGPKAGYYLDVYKAVGILKLDLWYKMPGAKGWGAGGTHLLLNIPVLAAGLDPFVAGEFWYMRLIVSPTFTSGGARNTVILVLNRAATEAAAKTINYDTHTDIWIINDSVMTATEQPHPTGRFGFRFETNKAQPTSLILRNYLLKTNGRPVESEYSAKNIQTGEIIPEVESSLLVNPIYCEPDQASQAVYVEGRIKNSYGSQSRTNEQDDYQGDTINNADPVAFLSVPKAGFTAADISIDGSQSIDPEGGSLIYKFDFGDSQVLETTQSIVAHQYAAAGTYTVKLIVEDEAGNDSAEVEVDIVIHDALDQFEEVTLLSPWTSINETSPPGTSKTSLPEVDYDVVQTLDGGNRVFRLTGIHSDPDCDVSEAVRMANAEAEREYFQLLSNKGKLISLDLEFFGIVRGVILDHVPSMSFDDQMAFQFTLTFQEVDVRQFED